jgi:hypothetical protein
MLPHLRHFCTFWRFFPGCTKDRVEHPGTSGDGFQNLADSPRRGKTPAKKYLLAISQQIFLTYSSLDKFVHNPQ